ncbi:GDP-mannose 4,6-dehydratase [Mucilaginibacter sp. X4EP1]|uniref:GDP-mannose 4,6-dehydratase n=1 Tax=Mucilaginibacter sp. X4EP1 TaxID=2723092 RepID=UPI00216A6FB3|nr:GDP-mannose 4,6-dehydratase [Mucilaginibacter sp. X4EP1]MCS3811720.1 GDPmannose 4,6-dehydratase [Mucilaginibacter sp. X4EP1]
MNTNNNNCIIWGINGQDGHYLKVILQNEGYNVIGISRSAGNWTQGNVSDGEFVKQTIIKYQPQFVFHLAADSTTSHKAIFENHSAISDGSLHILESVNQFSRHTKVFLSGSGLQFKNEGMPIKETDLFEGKSIYAVERIYTVYLARYFRQLGLKVYFGYFFHHDSPLRSERHLNMKIIKAAQAIKHGKQQILEIGNPDIVKEFNHAFDLMKAIWYLVKQDEVFEAVIGSGAGYKIMDWINICFDAVGIDKQNHIQLNPNFVSDFSSLVSNPETIKSLGWQPVYDIHSLALDMINNG